MNHRIARLTLTVIALMSLVGGHAVAQNAGGSSGPSRFSYVDGNFVATNYFNPPTGGVQVVTGNSTTGSSSIVLRAGYLVLGDGRSILPFSVTAPITINDANQETVTPTAVSNCNNLKGQSQDYPLVTCTITASFSNLHGAGAIVSSGTVGLQEAINDAFSKGGGTVVVDQNWTSKGGTTAMLAAAVPYQNVAILDSRLGIPQLWTMTPGTTTTVAAPTTLTALTAVPSTTPAGSYGTGTYFIAIAYVDAMGNEGQPSASFSEAGLASGSFVFTTPAASAGAVGFVPYISLTSGTYALAYRVPVSSTICTLTKIETTTAACAVTNSTYAQTGSTATVTAITVNTARLWVGLGGTSTTADYVGNSNARTTYIYAPSNHVGTPGMVSASTAFAGATAPATTVPAVLGTIHVPAGYMNYVGKTVRVCGLFTEASAGSTATVVTLELLWDADGSNTTGAPVIVSKIPITATLVTSNADQFTFCQNLKTTVSGASTTAGSIQAGAGFMTYSYGTVTTVAAAAGPTLGAAAVGSLNLAGEARIHVTYLHVTGTDGAAPTLTDLTFEDVN